MARQTPADGRRSGVREGDAAAMVLRDEIDIRDDAAVLSAQATAEWRMVQAWRRAMNMTDPLPPMEHVLGRPHSCTVTSTSEETDHAHASAVATKSATRRGHDSSLPTHSLVGADPNRSVRDGSGEFEFGEADDSHPCPLPEALIKFYATCPSTHALSASYQSSRELLFDEVRRRPRSEVEACAARPACHKLPRRLPVSKGGNHLCSVCMLPAPYRCVRCRGALFCSIDCHVIHDATRCLKFTV